MAAALNMIRKALLAGLAAGVAALVGVQPDGITSDEWLKVAAAAIVAGLAVWLVPNKAPVADNKEG